MSPSFGFPSFSKHFISVGHMDYGELNIFVAFHVKRLLFFMMIAITLYSGIPATPIIAQRSLPEWKGQNTNSCGL